MQNMINSYPDTLWIAAAGNDNSSRKFYPCAYDDVYCVAASSCGDQKASFSNYGEHVDITAPGTNILSTYPSNQYRKLNGTSMATPIVASLAALVYSYETDNE